MGRSEWTEEQDINPLSEFGPEIEAPKPLLAARKRLVRAERKAKPKQRKKRVPKAVRVAQTEAARAARAAKRAAEPQFKDVELTMPHWVNGVSYGPGRVRVPAEMVAGFLDTEQRVRQNDADLMSSSGKAAFIGPGGRRIPVPYGMMDAPQLSMIEAFSI